MKLWTLITNILLWPGRKAIAMFPNLGAEGTRLLHNMVNYIVWLTLVCGLLIYFVIKSIPSA